MKSLDVFFMFSPGQHWGLLWNKSMNAHMCRQNGMAMKQPCQPRPPPRLGNCALE